METEDSGTTIDTPSVIPESYSTEKSGHTKTRIRVPKKLKQQIDSYATGTAPSYTQYSEYSGTQGYSNTYGYSATQNSYNSQYSGYTPTYGPTGTYSYTGATGYSENPSQSQGNYSYTENPTYSYTNASGYSGTQGTYSYTNTAGNSGTQNYSYSYSTNGQTQSQQNSAGTDSSFSYTVFSTNPSTETATNNDAPSFTYTTDDSVTKRVRVKVKVPKKHGAGPYNKKREAARVFMHRNGVVANTDVRDESIDAVSLDPAGTSDLSTLDLPTAMAVPYVETVRPHNTVKKQGWEEDDSTLTQCEPEAQNFGKPLYSSRFLGRNINSSSDDESTTIIDTVVSEDLSKESDTIPTVMNKDEYNERFAVKERSVAVPPAQDGGFSQAEAARIKAEARQQRKADHKKAVEEAIKNGESPPPTLVTTATDELSTIEKEARMEVEMQELDEIMKKQTMDPELRKAMFPTGRRGKFVSENAKKLMFASSSDTEFEKEEEDTRDRLHLSQQPLVYEVGSSYGRTNVAKVAQGMGLFDSLQPMKLMDIKTYEPDTGEFNALREAEEARRQAEMERKIAEMRKMRDREIDTDTTTTDFSTSSTELAEISPEYLPKNQGGIPANTYKRTPALKLPPAEFDATKRTRPTRGGTSTATKTKETTESSVIEEIHEYLTSTDDHEPTVLVTANESSANYVEASENQKNAEEFVELTKTETITKSDTGESEKKRTRPQRGNKNVSAAYTSNLTTVSELRTANETSADYVEVSNSQKGETYVELPATTTATDLTTGHSEFVTATSGATGSLYVVESEGDEDYVVEEEEEEALEEEEEEVDEDEEV